ncbi:MAG TPA: hypothetical protein VF245_05905 [Solirubrobacterales bacterium]
MPPLVCPPPPDCPLYDQRLNYGSDEPLRRAILTERHSGPRLADLVRAEIATAGRPVPTLPPAPKPEPLPIFDHLKQKGVTP